MVVHFPHRRYDHRTDDHRAKVVMDVVYMPVWICRVVAIPTDVDANMYVVVPLVPVTVAMMPLVVTRCMPMPLDLVNATPISSVMAIVTLVMLGRTHRGTPDMRARSRVWLGQSHRGHSD
jgi:hypothetical protein